MIEVSDLVWLDADPPKQSPPPLSCRLSLWHHWMRVFVDGHTSYIECKRCHRSPTPTIFDSPIP